MEIKKRKHHYVFQSYLKSWTVNSKIWCYRNSKPFNTSTENIAQERDFYRLRPLNKDEYNLYQLFIQDYHPEVRKALNEHLWAYTLFEQDSYELDTLKKYVDFIKNQSFKEEIESLVTNLETLLDVAKNNTEEDFYSDIEGELIRWIELLKQSNSDFYYRNYDTSNFDNDAFRFLFDVCVQMFRTKATKKRWLERVQKSLDIIKKKTLTLNGVNLSNINLENLAPHYFWGFQNALAYNLYKSKAHLTILQNETERPFITSDQPVINLKSDYSSNEETKELLLYYPLSPKIAILINDECVDSVTKISDVSNIDYYNSAMIKASLTSIYSDSKEILDYYVNLL